MRLVVLRGPAVPADPGDGGGGLSRATRSPISPITMDDMRQGCCDPKARLEDMDVNWTEASLSSRRSRGSAARRSSSATTRSSRDLCVKAYNDWMFDEWCAGSGGRLIPLPIIQLWDAELAADEVRRNAARGGHAVCFTEIPPFLGLPSVHDADGYWDPFFQACAETETVVCMHIGSSSKMPSTSADAPPAVGSTLTYMNAAMSLTDYLMSGVLERFPTLELAYSEGQIGWIPYVLDRADKVWEENRGWGGVADKVTRPPSESYSRARLRLLLRRPARAANHSTRSASTTSRSRPTTRTATRRGRTPRGRRAAGRTSTTSRSTRSSAATRSGCCASRSTPRTHAVAHDAPPQGPDDLKRAAATRAVDDEVRSGMVVGLGTGSTAIHATRRIGELLGSGRAPRRHGSADRGRYRRRGAPCRRSRCSPATCPGRSTSRSTVRTRSTLPST